MASKITTLLVTFGLGAIVTVGLLLASGGTKDFISTKEVEFHKIVGAETSKKVLVVTRLHLTSAESMAAVSTVVSFVQNALKYSSKVLVCLGLKVLPNKDTYLEDLETELQRAGVKEQTELLLLEPWGGFTHSLNIATSYAVENHFDVIGFQSLETTVSPDVVSRLLTLFQDPNTLVVGPAFQGHEFKQGIQPMSGRVCPWNTLAFWDVKKLGLTGFPLIGNGFAEEVAGGVEEVTAVRFVDSIASVA
jgi:hypothetical protein